MADKTCTEQLDDLRDLINAETINRPLWLGFITLFRGVCRTLDSLDRAMYGNGKDDEPGILKILTEMYHNQQKRVDDKFSWRRILLEKVLPSILSAIIIGLVGAAAGWWLAINRLLTEHQTPLEGGGALLLVLLVRAVYFLILRR